VTGVDSSAAQNALWECAARGREHTTVAALVDAELAVLATTLNPLGLTAFHLAALGGQVHTSSHVLLTRSYPPGDARLSGRCWGGPRSGSAVLGMPPAVGGQLQSLRMEVFVVCFDGRRRMRRSQTDLLRRMAGVSGAHAVALVNAPSGDAVQVSVLTLLIF
jgi:hypothetical protein